MMSRKNYWRYTALMIVIAGFIDASAAVTVLLWGVHTRWWTFLVCVGCFIFFGALGIKGYTLPVLGRRIRSLIAGKIKVAIPWWRKPQRSYRDMRGN